MVDEITQIAQTVIHDLLTSSLQAVFVKQSIDIGTTEQTVQ